MKRSLHSGGSQRRARTRTANEGGKPGRGCAAETKAASMLIQIFCKTNIFLSHKKPSRARFFENSSFCSSVGQLDEGFGEFMTSSSLSVHGHCCCQLLVVRSRKLNTRFFSVSLQHLGRRARKVLNQKVRKYVNKFIIKGEKVWFHSCHYQKFDWCVN